MNVDGVRLSKGSEQNIWSILLVVNVVEWKRRFVLQNLVVGKIWPGPAKPSRSQISLLFEHIVRELKELEKGHRFSLYSSAHGDCAQILKVFLIGSCGDKPAQALIQCLPEPRSYSGCARCEIQGELNTSRRCLSVALSHSAVMRRIS